MRSSVKNIILRLMLWTGLVRLFQFVHRKQTVILMIHGVMDNRAKPRWKPLRPQLAPAKLEEYLRGLSKRHHFISLTDALDMLEGRKPMTPYSVVLTFDDGYRNNITYALPILHRYSAPATFFLPTGFVSNPRPFWFDRLDYALQQAPVHGREVKVGSLSMRLDASSRNALRESYKRLRRTAKELQMSDHDFLHDMEQLACQLEAESGHALSDLHRDDDWSAMMTWDQIEGCRGAAVTFGSHTVDHVRLDLVSAAEAREQLSRSKRDIEVHTGQTCFAVCYPNGSFSEETIAFARESGYRCGLTTEEGLNCVGDNVMALRRIDLPAEGSNIGLLVMLCGLSELVSNTMARLAKMARHGQRTHDDGGDSR
ncbi:MAG: polysaccharide deacetylase family protein [Sedimentisphaerales bacterium]|jgi:peptidoglycan/xylan/chitin deacetylase (PgdA/CDA1 family)|nr:polysaccharide deacetylase family protein [Sedimentisphaerales bacterium]HNY76814.1 polysaccharide deacetylase family protein [Sedimentisphaerales bacterium]HOC61579.1 polysaccharide deacetylase family protein [Sedimentisphaerales bacterium]HOH62411.1 polysaccharide deacetylase family protein [Sedimentisphaerales bacterium]HQN31850.1 polysaccharide deacetylase family protein [Sedimentisphaerales bacterium]